MVLGGGAEVVAYICYAVVGCRRQEKARLESNQSNCGGRFDEAEVLEFTLPSSFFFRKSAS